MGTLLDEECDQGSDGLIFIQIDKEFSVSADGINDMGLLVQASQHAGIDVGGGDFDGGGAFLFAEGIGRSDRKAFSV